MRMSPHIHPTAVIHPSAVIGEGVEIGAYSVIGEKVAIGDNTSIGHHTVVEGHTTIGKENRIYHFASIGGPPQDIKYKGEDTRVEIGDGNIIREYVTINRGTPQGAGVTRIGDRCFIMTGCHIAHDCTLGDDVIMANLASLSGHVQVESGAVFGGMAGVHQFIRIGTLTMIAAGALVGKDVPPYTIAAGDRARLYGLNLIGLRRRKMSPETIGRIKSTFNIVFRSGLARKEALSRARSEAGGIPEVECFLSFMEKEAKRGYCVPAGKEEEWED